MNLTVLLRHPTKAQAFRSASSASRAAKPGTLVAAEIDENAATIWRSLARYARGWLRLLRSSLRTVDLHAARFRSRSRVRRVAVGRGSGWQTAPSTSVAAVAPDGEVGRPSSSFATKRMGASSRRRRWNRVHRETAAPSNMSPGPRLWRSSTTTIARCRHSAARCGGRLRRERVRTTAEVDQIEQWAKLRRLPEHRCRRRWRSERRRSGTSAQNSDDCETPKPCSHAFTVLTFLLAPMRRLPHRGRRTPDGHPYGDGHADH